MCGIDHSFNTTLPASIRARGMSLITLMGPTGPTSDMQTPIIPNASWNIDGGADRELA
jgi:hypothetical protein